MQVHTDWHIHSRHSPCGKPEATMALIWREARAAGISALGVTDHLNCHLNEAALRAARQEYDALTGKGSFLFGLEVCCLRRYDLDEAERLGAAASAGRTDGAPAAGVYDRRRSQPSGRATGTRINHPAVPPSVRFPCMPSRSRRRSPPLVVAGGMAGRPGDVQLTAVVR